MLAAALNALDLKAPLELFRHPGAELYVPYLLFNLAGAGAITLWRRAKGERAGLMGFDRRSSRADVTIFLVNTVVFSSTTSALLLGPKASHWVSARLSRFIGHPVLVHGLAARIIFTIAALLAIDFAIYVAHYAQHRLPVLWCFHKVHHSARVLTPLTAYRNHPVDELLESISSTVVIGICEGILLTFLDPRVSALQIAGINALFLLALALLANLRHSHAWLTVGPFEYVISSPAQHQIHHSIDAAHYDRNFGGILSIWDGLFGTLVVPARRQSVTFGLEGADEQFPNLASYYWAPVRESVQVLTRHRAVPTTPVREVAA